MAEKKQKAETSMKADWIHNSGGVGGTGGEAPWIHPGGPQKQEWGWRMWLWPIGLLGPLIGSVISIVILIIILWLLKFLNVMLQSLFITQFIDAVTSNIVWIFGFFLFMAYAKFLMMRSRSAYYVFHPLSEAVSTTFVAWVLGWLLKYAGEAMAVPLISAIGTTISASLVYIFAFVLILNYAALLFSRR